MTEYTPNFSFELIDFNIKPWADKEHNNWSMMDRILGTISTRPELRGSWKNNVSYAVGDQALDPQSLLFYTCLVAHTSPATGLFSDYRAANPSNWQQIQSGSGFVRYDTNQGLTDAQKLQARTNVGSQAALGFTPVQQGGGTGQNTDLLQLGNSSTGLRATAAGIDQGKVWTDAQAAKSLTQSGYQKLPSGLIIQWGYDFGGSGQQAIALPIAWPNGGLSVQATPANSPGTGTMFACAATLNGLTGITLYKRTTSGGTTADGTFPSYWTALGY